MNLLDNYLDLPKPHGWLIYRGKQTAIANDEPLATGQKLLIVSDDNAYGEAVLGQPMALSLSEFERLESEHCIRQEERKLFWPDRDVFYLHRIINWQPFEEIKAVKLNGDSIEFADKIVLTDAQRELLQRADRLPKTLVLSDDVVTWDGDKAVIRDGLESDKVNSILQATLDGAKSDGMQLPLYQLALVRVPRFWFKEKKSDTRGEGVITTSAPGKDWVYISTGGKSFVEVQNSSLSSEVKAMPYKTVNNHPECDEDKPVGLVGPGGKLTGCHEDMQAAMAQAEAIMAEEKGRGKPKPKMGAGKPKPKTKELESEKRYLTEDELKCGPEMMGYMMGATTFADMMEMEEMHEAMEETHKLTAAFSGLASNIMSSPDIEDKPAALKALADEYAGLIEGAMAQKAYEDKWGSAGASREEDKAEDRGGYLITGEEGNHLPTRKNGKVDHGLMGAAWAALHGGYRGNKYEGPGKGQALDKLKRLYASEGLDTPGEKGDGEVPEDEKAGRRMRASMMDKLKSAWHTIKELMDWAEEPMMDDDEEMGMIGFDKGFGVAVKRVNGEPWHFAWSTNAFEDREKEIFSTKALEKYVTEAEQKGDMGFFNLWHIGTKENPALTDFAEIKWQGVIGRILVEAGPYLKDEKGQAAKAYFLQYADSDPDLAPEGWGASPEYRYLPEERKTGVYENIWKTRTSILPRLAAANIWTKGATIMALSEQQKATAVKIFGEEAAAQIITDAEKASRELEARVAHKGENEVTEEASPEVDAILNVLAQLDIPALNNTIQLLAEGQEQLNTRLDELAGEVKGLEKTKKLEQQTQTPRFAWQNIQRASEAQKTIVADDDALKNKKPVETEIPAQDNSGAAHFFPSPRR